MQKIVDLISYQGSILLLIIRHAVMNIHILSDLGNFYEWCRWFNEFRIAHRNSYFREDPIEEILCDWDFGILQFSFPSTLLVPVFSTNLCLQSNKTMAASWNHFRAIWGKYLFLQRKETEIIKWENKLFQDQWKIYSEWKWKDYVWYFTLLI